MSVGVACYPEDASDGASLINRADNDMYHRKSLRKSGLREVPVIEKPLEQLA
jgi:GGDEF domain-containing protein